MQEWYLGWEKVSCLERCPHRERGSTVSIAIITIAIVIFQSSIS